MDRYEAECRLVQLWEDLALLDRSSRDVCRGNSRSAQTADMMNAQTADMMSAQTADVMTMGENSFATCVALAHRFDSGGRWPENVLDAGMKHAVAHTSWGAVARLAVSISADTSTCSRLCDDLAAELARCLSGTAACAALDACGSAPERAEAMKPKETAAADSRSACMACAGCGPCALRGALEAAVLELEVARSRAGMLEDEVRHYREEEERLSLQAMEREEELEAAVLHKTQLAEAQMDLAARLARAQGRIQELKDMNRSLMRALPAHDASAA